MEEDDLLDRGFSERDLRRKLQRGGAQPDQVRVLERDTGISTARSSNLRDSTARSGQISTEREGARGLFYPRDNRDARSMKGDRQGPKGEYKPRPDLRKELEKAKNKSSSSQGATKSGDSVKCFHCT